MSEENVTRMEGECPIPRQTSRQTGRQSKRETDRETLTDTRRDWRPTLLIAERTAATRETSDAGFTRTLTGCMTAIMSEWADQMTLTRWTHTHTWQSHQLYCLRLLSTVQRSRFHFQPTFYQHNYYHNDVIWQCTVLYLRVRRSVLICHHVLAATNWFYMTLYGGPAAAVR